MTDSTSPSLHDINHINDNVCRILTLDGGGAKGFYTLERVDLCGIKNERQMSKL